MERPAPYRATLATRRGEGRMVQNDLDLSGAQGWSYYRASRRESPEANLGTEQAAWVRIVLNVLYWGYPCRTRSGVQQASLAR